MPLKDAKSLKISIEIIREVNISKIRTSIPAPDREPFDIRCFQIIRQCQFNVCTFVFRKLWCIWILVIWVKFTRKRIRQNCSSSVWFSRGTGPEIRTIQAMGFTIKYEIFDEQGFLVFNIHTSFNVSLVSCKTTNRT